MISKKGNYCEVRRENKMWTTAAHIVTIFNTGFMLECHWCGLFIHFLYPLYAWQPNRDGQNPSKPGHQLKPVMSASIRELDLHTKINPFGLWKGRLQSFNLSLSQAQQLWWSLTSVTGRSKHLCVRHRYWQTARDKQTHGVLQYVLMSHHAHAHQQ